MRCDGTGPCRSPTTSRFADGGYQGPQFARALAKVLPHLDVEIVKRSDRVSGFVVLPKRWIVERSIAWLNRCRRLAKDWENLNRKALAFLRLASIRFKGVYCLDRCPTPASAAIRDSHGLGVPQSYAEWYQRAACRPPRRARAVRALTGCLSPPAGSACEVGATGPTILLVEIKLTSALPREPGRSHRLPVCFEGIAFFFTSTVVRIVSAQFGQKAG
jgi:transposase